MMRLKERRLSAAVFVPVALMVTVLAFVQYRWSNQVSEATRLRLADSLQMSMINWHQDLFRVFSQICFISALDRQDGAPTDPRRYTRSLSEWRAVASYPDLISNLYIVRLRAAGGDLLRFNSFTSHFEPDAWPASFRTVREQLTQLPGDAGADSGPGGIQISKSTRRDQLTNSFYPARILEGWQFEPSIPALLHPITNSGIDSQPIEWIVVELNDDVIRNKVMPDLARRYFQGTDGLDFQVAVIGGEPRRVIYSSDRDLGQQTIVDADGTLNVFGRVRDGTLDSPVRVFHDTSADTGPSSALDVSWFPLFSNPPQERDWQLLVRHRRGGPLGAFAAELRRRDLALSFGILFLLVVSMGMLITTARRAQSLAKLQMDFVTTVSHELRTPLTVITLAADNIIRGVVDGKQHLATYGSVIQTQAHQLCALVEQVLLFAATREGRQWYAFQPVDVSEIIKATLVNRSTLAPFSQFTVEQDIEPDVPPVMGDAVLLSQCIQNLINNALKYGGTEKWLGISVHFDPTVREVVINIADRGIGISSDDLPHIFEPFYRSPSVVLAQVHGTGLGLALAKNIAEATKGRLTVRSSLGKGSTFTLRVPCADPTGKTPKLDRSL
jgi:two-component system, OmpR family, sensor histidine kinase SenX3